MLRPWLRRLMPLLLIGLILLVWSAVSAWEIYPAFLIPPPGDVADEFGSALESGLLWKHTRATLIVMISGLAAGVGFGLLLGYLIAKMPLLEETLSPVIVAFQSTPLVAYAPLLIIWFGTGPTSKIVTTAIVVFFPALVNTIVGMRGVPIELREVMRSWSASWWHMFSRLEIPAAMPVLLGGLKTSATLAVIGAVVGEFVNASEGLGKLLLEARYAFDTPLVFVTVLTMTSIALLLYGTVSLLEWKLIGIRQAER